MAELCSPEASHRKKGSASLSSTDKDKDDTFFRSSFSKRGSSFSPLTYKLNKVETSSFINQVDSSNSSDTEKEKLGESTEAVKIWLVCKGKKHGKIDLNMTMKVPFIQVM